MDPSRQQARARVATGVSAWDRQDYESALLTFQEVLEAHPYFADVHNKAGLCLAMLGRAEEALEHFERALGINSSYAEAHFNRAIVLNDAGRHEEARAAFERAGEIDTRDSSAFPSDLGNRLAVTHAQLGDLYLVADLTEEAAEHYRQALAVRPRFADIRSKYAEALIALGRLEEAREELEWILEARPEFVGARVRLGVVLRRLGDEAGAVREWRRSARDDPGDMRPRAYLASVGQALPAGDAGDGEPSAAADVS